MLQIYNNIFYQQIFLQFFFNADTEAQSFFSLHLNRKTRI
jgi:hypothetical protein